MVFRLPQGKITKLIEVFLHRLDRFFVGFLGCCTTRLFFKPPLLFLETSNSFGISYDSRHLFLAPPETGLKCEAKNDLPDVHFPSSNPQKCQPNL